MDIRYSRIIECYTVLTFLDTKKHCFFPNTDTRLHIFIRRFIKRINRFPVVLKLSFY